MYRTEVVDGEAKLASMSKDDNYYSQTRNALEESKTMVDHTHANLSKAVKDLESKLDSTSPFNDEAKELITKAEAALKV